MDTTMTTTTIIIEVAEGIIEMKHTGAHEFFF